MRRAIVIVLLGAFVLGGFGCAGMSKTDKGVAIGAGSGAVIGGAIGAAAGNTAMGAILGAVIGGAAGGIIGNYMDDQAEEMERDLEGAEIERVGEGIKVTFDSGLLFDVDSADLRSEAKQNLSDLAIILIKYEDTDILLEGHTDSDGTEDYNMRLSERRARAVQTYLVSQNVRSARTTVMWYGETQPVADNDSTEGKQQNRRVEVAVMANEELQEAAEEQAASQG